MSGWRVSIARSVARLSSATLTALALLCTFAALPAFAVDESNLLPVDQAFALSAKATDRGRIELNWNIAKGYYLYRERISAQPDAAAFKSDPLQLPEGIHKHDQFFGDVQIYHDLVKATLTGTAASGVTAVDVTVKYQGCADAGVCYPPQKRSLHIALPAQGSATIVAGANTGTASTNPIPAHGEERIEAQSAEAASRTTRTNPSALAALTGRSTGKLPGTDALPLPAEQAFGFEA
ncbi:MAG TPA: protein-disulfide reductase DsbD domain-containing protein, partial [Xanthomonadaceae bacterium]|nr:protein-disulfide reductase DsbD domain-containing protein [Xanthomonadaceae bacterium]